jgi:two-component system sensor histidine kinase TctE
MKGKNRKSLTTRLRVGMILPTVGLALILALSGMLVIQNIVESVNDRVLNASAVSIADTLAYEDGDVTVDLPLSAFGMLENEERDNVYYCVRRGNELVTGYPELPVIADVSSNQGGAVYRYSTYRDVPIRMVAIARRVPRIAEPVVVQVAETLVARNHLRQRMLVSLGVVEALLIGLLLSLLPLSVRWGLRPLAQLRENLNRRDAQDFTPLNIEEAPVEMHEFLTAFNGLVQRLHAAMEGLRKFSADASHQMRTSLSILRTHLTILRHESDLSEDGASSLRDIDDASRRLARMLTQFLALAHAQDGSQYVIEYARPVDLTELTRSVAEEMVPLALSRGVQLELVEPDRTIEILTVGALVTEILKNLVDNAIRYNNSEGFVTLSIVTHDMDDRVIIEDDGPGIPHEERENVFKRFYRLRHDDVSRQGSGLGLAIVKALADSIGAEVIIGEREKGPGLKVEVVFHTSPDNSVTGG